MEDHGDPPRSYTTKKFSSQSSAHTFAVWLQTCFVATFARLGKAITPKSTSHYYTVLTGTLGLDQSTEVAPSPAEQEICVRTLMGCITDGDPVRLMIDDSWARLSVYASQGLDAFRILVQELRHTHGADTG